MTPMPEPRFASEIEGITDHLKAVLERVRKESHSAKVAESCVGPIHRLAQELPKVVAGFEKLAEGGDAASVEL